MSARYTPPKTDVERKRTNTSAYQRASMYQRSKALVVTVWVLVGSMILSLFALGATAL